MCHHRNHNHQNHCHNHCYMQEVKEVKGEGESAVTMLAAALGCTRFFAKKVVNAVQAGTEDELFQ